MADERDPQVSRRYRELGAEAPPPGLDQAILAASRRAMAPRRRWYVPLAAAAVAVLAVGVALHVQRERPDPEGVTAPSVAKDAPREMKQAPAPAAPPEPQLQYRKREASGDLAREAPERADRGAEDSGQGAGASRLEQRPTAPAKPAQEAARPPVPQTAPVPQAAPAPPAPRDLLGARVHEDPERWLERIAELRRQGRHQEADKAFADFRERYPDYRIPEQMLGKIQKK